MPDSCFLIPAFIEDTIIKGGCLSPGWGDFVMPEGQFCHAFTTVHFLERQKIYRE